jgi:hypothetical protein
MRCRVQWPYPGLQAAREHGGAVVVGVRRNAVSAQRMGMPCAVVLREDLVAVCPHCESEIPEIYARKPRGPFGMGRGFMFFCPHCRKVLGFGTQWYPFPG